MPTSARVAISTDPSSTPHTHYLHELELPHEDEERLASLFKSLDVDGNGKIDIHDLSLALHDFGVHPLYAKSFLERADSNQSSDISLAEFIHYVKEHEKNLRLGFSHIDKNRDGKIDLEELIRAFKDLGVDVEVNEAEKLLKRMDQDGSLEISYSEWRDFLLYAPYSNIHDLIKYWRHSTYLDIGEDLNVPDDFTAAEMQTGMWWRHLVAGGVAGAISRTCTAPLDRIKVHMQVHGVSTTMLKTVSSLYKEGGFWSFWRGNGINVLKIAPESAMKFMAYEQIKKAIKFNKNDRNIDLSIYERFVAGSAAGAVSQTMIYPLEVLKTRLALRKTGEYASIMDAAKKILKREGTIAFYRGYIPNLIGIIPYAGIDLAVYETLKKMYLEKFNQKEAPSAFVLLFCGTASSTCGQFCSYPFALVRTRLQAQITDKDKASNRTSVTKIISNIIRQEGFFGLYRGITPNFMKVAPAVSISYVVYEKCREALGINMT